MKIVVTAGPTREAIDPVRFISNRSSGKMGYAIAEEAIEAGHEVILISGPVALTPPASARVINIVNSDELRDAVHAATRDCDVLVMCAAVCDYKPVEVATQKMPKARGEFSLRLTNTTDILASLPRGDRSCFVVGFAAETHELAANAQKKLRAKNCDMIVANDVSGNDSGMESDFNAVTIFTRDDQVHEIARAEKKIIAREILKKIFAMQQKSFDKKNMTHTHSV